MKNMSQLAKDIFKYGFVKDCPVIDMHGHMGTFYGIHFPTYNAKKMVQAMREANVKKLVFSHHGCLMSNAGNQLSINEARKFPEYLKVYFVVNPNYPKIAEKELACFNEAKDVYVGIKMLASYHQKPITDNGYKKAWEFANKRRLLVLLHTWGNNNFNGPEQVEEVAKKYPDCKIFMGHSIHGDWDKAVELVNKFDNVYYELTAVLDERGPLEKFIEKSGSEKILFGTDMPWFSYHNYIGAVLGAAKKEEDIRNILYRNAEKLLKGLSI